jgi:hypothetical protein
VASCDPVSVVVNTLVGLSRAGERARRVRKTGSKNCIGEGVRGRGRVPDPDPDPDPDSVPDLDPSRTGPEPGLGPGPVKGLPLPVGFGGCAPLSRCERDVGERFGSWRGVVEVLPVPRGPAKLPSAASSAEAGRILAGLGCEIPTGARARVSCGGFLPIRSVPLTPSSRLFCKRHAPTQPSRRQAATSGDKRRQAATSGDKRRPQQFPSPDRPLIRIRSQSVVKRQPIRQLRHPPARLLRRSDESALAQRDIAAEVRPSAAAGPTRKGRKGLPGLRGGAVRAADRSRHRRLKDEAAVAVIERGVLERLGAAPADRSGLFERLAGRMARDGAKAALPTSAETALGSDGEDLHCHKEITLVLVIGFGVFAKIPGH